MTIAKTPFYFYAGVANALGTLAIIPIRKTEFGKSHIGSQLLGSAPSFLGILALLMLLLSALKPKSPKAFWIIVITVTGGTLVHEILQNWTEKIFDYLDLAAILCGFLTFCSIHLITSRVTRNWSNQGMDFTR